MANLKPILFNTEMVRAILDGCKTTTRRVVKAGNHAVLRGGRFPGAIDGSKIGAELDNHAVLIAPYQPGDILYVRETWSHVFVHPKRYLYKADAAAGMGEGAGLPIKWHPSIHMPKEAARIFLRVTNVRADHLRNMTVHDLQSEGILPQGYISQYAVMTSDCFERFKTIWNITIKPADRDRYGWAANPWVWVIEFERIEKTKLIGGDA